MKHWLSDIDHLSNEIRRHEGFWVRVFNEKGEYYNFDCEALKDTHYSLWSKKSADKMTVGQWEEIRFKKIAPLKRMIPQVYFENGEIANYYTTLSDVRKTKCLDFCSTGRIYFKFDCPTKDVAYRINEKLIEREYNTKIYLSDGLFKLIGKFYYVFGLIEPVEIFPWEYPEWHQQMLDFAKIYSSDLKISFIRTSDFDVYHFL